MHIEMSGDTLTADFITWVYTHTQEAREMYHVPDSCSIRPGFWRLDATVMINIQAQANISESDRRRVVLHGFNIIPYKKVQPLY